MDWSNERYVRVYTRDTADWMTLAWQSRALFWEILRHCDRSGVLTLGKHGSRALAGVIRWPPDVVESALDELLADGCIQPTDGGVVVRGFIEAQELPSSDRLRQAELRARRRNAALAINGKGTPKGSVSEHSPDPAQLTLEPKPDGTSDVRHVFDHWRTVCGHPKAKLDGKRERRIRDAIARHGVAECLRAVDGCKASPFHQGDNKDGQRYDDVELILRDAAHVERFVGMLSAPAVVPADVPRNTWDE